VVNRDRVDHHRGRPYHGVGFSDIMQTHMIRHEIEEILKAVATDVSLSYTKPIGKTRLRRSGGGESQGRAASPPRPRSPFTSRTWPAHRHVW
jgi:hypothetical protein